MAATKLNLSEYPEASAYYNNKLTLNGFEELNKLGVEFVIEDGKVTSIEGGANNG